MPVRHWMRRARWSVPAPRAVRSGTGDSVRDAQANAYAGVAKVSWANAFHRTDIGWRAIAREE